MAAGTGGTTNPYKRRDLAISALWVLLCGWDSTGGYLHTFLERAGAGRRAF